MKDAEGAALMACAEFEDRLSDFREGTLTAEESAAQRRHLQTCAACQALLDDVAVAAAQLAALPRLAVPERLLAAIRRQTLQPPPAGVPRVLAPAWRRAWRTVMSPRFAMGVAMSIFGVALLLNAAQVNLRDLFQGGDGGGFSATTLVNGIARQADRTWARGVSYYHDLRVVYEIEAAIHALRQPTAPAAAPAGHDRSQRGPGMSPEQLALAAPASSGEPYELLPAL
ncbi:MAG: anti-sigma factor family protein [Terriglobales bacterium]